MKVQEARYVTSATESEGFPVEGAPEFAFAGRSNVGKSTLINTLVGVSKLARASNTPGRTRLLNWFEVIPKKGVPIHFVDFPGFGYARVPREMRDAWRPLVESYLSQRGTLRLVFVLIDARRGAQKEEEELLEWLIEFDRPVCVVMTKSDKINKSKRKLVASAIQRQLALAKPPIMSSSESKDGVSEIWRILSTLV